MSKRVINISNEHPWIPYKDLSLVILSEEEKEIIEQENTVIVKGIDIHDPSIIPAALYRIARDTGRADLEAIAQIIAHEREVEWILVRKTARENIEVLVNREKYDVEKYGEELARIRGILIRAYVRYLRSIQKSKLQH